MKHIEEHIVELYVLGAEKVRDQRGEIEVHLSECAGCRLLAERIGEFYRTADGEFKRLSEQPAGETKALARVEHHLERLYAPEAPAIPLRRSSRLERVGMFARRHPVVAGVGSFAFGGAAIAALAFMFSGSLKDANPSYVYYNLERGMFEARNKEDAILWEKPVSQLAEEQKYEQMNGIKRTVVADLYGNGANEIVTTMTFAGERWRENRLRIFDGKRNLLFERSFDRQFQYLDRQYDPVFGLGALIVDDFNGSGEKQILVRAQNLRSPMFVARLSARGNEIGTYWHFGQLNEMQAVDLNGDGKKEITLGGQSDVSDTNHQEFPVIVVLDPLKIVGDSKSTGAPGYRLPPSDAEMYYIRLPNSDMNVVLNVHLSVQRLLALSESTVHFNVWSGMVGTTPSFEFIFTRDMKILQVKSEDLTYRLHAQMVKEGKLKGRLDEAYLDNLKNGVRYWDGKEWVKEAVKVKHLNELSMVNPPKARLAKGG